MGWVSGIVVFIITWWTALFAVLPWGLKRDERGIPFHINIRRKALITTMVSVIIWLAIYVLMKADIISFRHMADLMMRKDYGT